MSNLIAREVDRGFDSHIRDAAELPIGSAADGSQNVLYSRGTAKTPFGFGKVAINSLPLDGAPILGIAKWSQLDKTEHFMAITTSKIFDKNNVTDAWDEKTQGVETTAVDLEADEQLPVSTTVSLHTDALPLNGTGEDWFQHFLVNPGGSGKLQRWAGNREIDFADVLGGSDYHDDASTYTGHYALQVGSSNNHVLLISPREANINNELIDNPQRVRWNQIAKLESWQGVGSGAVDLFDRGGYNVWGAMLGKQWIQYQNNSIWSLTHVGGNTIFAPRVEIPDLGLLAPHLVFAKNNIHYFIGNDFNVYGYAGGSVKRIIGNNIQRYLQRDMEKSKGYRCWMVMGAENSRLWLYIVPTGSNFATFAYGMDIITGSWMKRDLLHKWPTATEGISAVALVGSGSFTTGKTYRMLLAETAPFKTVAIGGLVRTTNVVTATVTDTFGTGFIVGETAMIADVDSGAEANAFSGSFTVLSTPTPQTFTYAQTGADEANLATGTALVDKAPTSTDYLNLGLTSRQMLTEVLTDEVIALGDAAGNVYQYSSDALQDDGVDIPATHITEIYDLREPSINKLWPPFRFSAKGTSITVSYRLASFETTDTGWVPFPEITLTSDFVDYIVYPNVTSKKIQYRFTNANGDDFQIANYDIGDVEFVGEA